MSQKKPEASRSQRAADVVRHQKKAEQKRTFALVGSVVAVLVIVVGAMYFWQSSRDTTGEVTAGPSGTSSQYGLAVGPKNAPSKVIIYEDFLCPFCGELERASSDRLSELAEEGKVQVEYRPFNLLSSVGDYSLRATNAFAATMDQAGPEAAKKLHDELFADQPSESGPFPDDKWLVEKAVQAGADQEKITRAIEDREFEQWVVNATDDASKNGVNGTPTVLLNGEQVTGSTIDEIVDNLVTKIEENAK